MIKVLITRNRLHCGIRQRYLLLPEPLVGKALYRFSNNPAPNFPVAQNTHAYQDAHRELYSYVLDGLDKQTIERIAAHQGLTLKTSSDQTLKALEKALPTLPPGLRCALDKVIAERGNAGHSVRPRHSGFWLSRNSRPTWKQS